MADLKPIKRNPFKRGDTVCFQYEFSPPYAGFDWSTVRLDCAFTKDAAPINNDSAAASRTNQTLTVNSDGSAYYVFQLTHAESADLEPGQIYNDECQLKENGTNYLTPVWGQTLVKQDYVI